MTDNKFRIGELVKLVGVIRSMQGFEDGVIWYSVEVEGGLPIPAGTSSCVVNEKAVRSIDDNDKEFFEARNKNY